MPMLRSADRNHDVDATPTGGITTGDPQADGTGTLGAELLDTLEPWPAFLDRFSIAYARTHRMLGLLEPTSGRPYLLIAGERPNGVDVARRLLDPGAEVAQVPQDELLPAINRAYEQQDGQTLQAIEAVDGRDPFDPAELSAAVESEDLLDGDGRAPVVKLVNMLLFEAVRQHASDIHVQPQEGRTQVRLRIDGVLFDAYELPGSVQDELVSRVKVMARMNIAEKRMPQDGRATVKVGDRVVDLRLSTVPTSHGERVVFRLLDKSARQYALDDLGMDAATLTSFERVIGAEHGLILVTGPTGSGKSTTLYGSLQRINATELNVLTLEDPIEYQVPGISQMQVADRKGMTFARGLRSVLRQDPDVIMVGEIRDRETAELAIQAALTGHLVFSTLHTNDAASAVTRLLDLGIEPYLVASSLLAVMAQRLVRQNCPGCSGPVDPREAARQLERLGVNPDRADLSGLRRGRGCPACRETGYRGRAGLFEYLPLDEAMREPIQHRAAASAIKELAVRRGLKTLRDDGIEKVLAGRTTGDEVLRVTHKGVGTAGLAEAGQAEREREA